jgi:hypothetical protein
MFQNYLTQKIDKKFIKLIIVILFSCVLQEIPPNYNESQYIADTRSPPSYTQGTFVNGLPTAVFLCVNI